MGKLYIAYGSNLNIAQMAARCPSATVYSIRQLNNWILLYKGRNGNAHATIARKFERELSLTEKTFTMNVFPVGASVAALCDT